MMRVREGIWVKCIVDVVIDVVVMVVVDVMFVWSCRCCVVGGGCGGCGGDGSWCGCGGSAFAASVASRRCLGGNRCRFVVVLIFFRFICDDRTHACWVAYAH